MTVREVPLLFLDLDGTVRKGKSELGRFVNGPDDVAVFPEAITMMETWKIGGGRIIGITNQGGVALGIVPETAVDAAIIETQHQAHNLFDAILVCMHHPDANDPVVAYCWCRKPSPGMIFKAIRTLDDHHPEDEVYPMNQALMVGDRPEDEECAKRAGIQFLSADLWRSYALDGVH